MSDNWTVWNDAGEIESGLDEASAKAVVAERQGEPGIYAEDNETGEIYP